MLNAVTLEEGVRALMGLIMATSACPVFNINLNLTSLTSPTFASREESVLRLQRLCICLVSIY
ncbi:MAG: hypothetical protein IPP76_04775 [Moraxellaceae bacterium]|nr:hypothetical protein [Moraxellaceae bacterium]